MGSKLKDVAALAGVSVRTVSNVVNNPSAVAVATRERVLAAISETGYRPNLAARYLRQGRTGQIGLAIPEVGSPYFGELAGLLIEKAHERGWTMLIDQTAGRAERERYLLSGAEGHVVDGLIISPWSLAPEEIGQLAGSTPVVVLGEIDPCGTADHLAVDNVAAAREATRHLLARGARRPAALGPQPTHRNGTAALRLRGYREALTEAGMRQDPAYEIAVTSLHRPEGHRAMLRLMGLENPPDAVFCFTDELALGALRAAREGGLRVPEDVALIGFDDIEDGRYSTPSLSTVSPDKDGLAERGLQLIADRLYGRLDALPARRVTAPHVLVHRETS
ncbi:LacI family DNA-binding transcriptional regulator [Streptomyces montanisoli]|uniref:LacI family DNA-binding transcriptional regulator n=1 Tax=Streptomyces montanisoli TaxID=2798581 RepID=A0A940MBF4_9ACTN|nr:LacI family DNA-binding transcriptional regulator [Streptomyces montanisoli]MBP0459855.1 LacI family DNA-binding transcriptional regulator [Streptomyces montanisoli]